LVEDQISPLAEDAAHHALNELTVKVSLLVMDGSKMINMQEKKLNANFTTVHLADAVKRGRGQVYVSIGGLDQCMVAGDYGSDGGSVDEVSYMSKPTRQPSRVLPMCPGTTVGPSLVVVRMAAPTTRSLRSSSSILSRRRRANKRSWATSPGRGCSPRMIWRV
jgi:hypothetical protein